MTQIQEIILEIFKEVAKILDNHNIPYYAIGGTCIGAIRHKGFIPWDDDLDIAVPVEYWDKLIHLLKTELPLNLYLYSSDNIQPYHYVWLKVCDKNTTFIEKSEYRIKKAWKGIFIDIMPLGGIPKDNEGVDKYINRLSRLEKLNDYLRFPYVIASWKSLFGRMPFRILSKVLPYNYYSKQYVAELKKYPLSESTKTGYVWHPRWLPRLIFPTSYFEKGIQVDFEDTRINIPVKYHDYLTQQFGDYMVLPSEDKREIHKGFVDTQKSFTYYYNKELK